MMGEVDRDIGKLEAQVETLTWLVSELGQEVKYLREEFAEVRGGWKAVLAIAAMAGAALSWASNYFLGKH